MSDNNDIFGYLARLLDKVQCYFLISIKIIFDLS